MRQGSTTCDAKILCMMKYRVKPLFEGILNIIEIRNWVNPLLGGTTRNYFKEWLRNQEWSNHFLVLNIQITMTSNYLILIFFQEPKLTVH
jgi:hypothetical protein